jgi:hypothetical protein
VRWGASLALAFAASACAPLSHFEDARTLPAGEFELTGSRVTTGLSVNDERDGPFPEETSILFRWGLARENADFRVRLTAIDYGESSAFALGFGPKFSNETGTAAFLLGVNAITGEGHLLPIITPAVLITMPVHERTDVNLALRTNVTPISRFFTYGILGGLGVEFDGGRWRARPEGGAMMAGREVVAWHMGVGVSYRWLGGYR